MDQGNTEQPNLTHLTYAVEPAPLLLAWVQPHAPIRRGDMTPMCPNHTAPVSHTRPPTSPFVWAPSRLRRLSPHHQETRTRRGGCHKAILTCLIPLACHSHSWMAITRMCSHPRRKLPVTASTPIHGQTSLRPERPSHPHMHPIHGHTTHLGPCPIRLGPAGFCHSRTTCPRPSYWVLALSPYRPRNTASMTPYVPSLF